MSPMKAKFMVIVSDFYARLATRMSKNRKLAYELYSKFLDKMDDTPDKSIKKTFDSNMEPYFLDPTRVLTPAEVEQKAKEVFELMAICDTDLEALQILFDMITESRKIVDITEYTNQIGILMTVYASTLNENIRLMGGSYEENIPTED